MSITEMETKARELKELKLMQEELTDEITTLEDALKAGMGGREQVVAGAYKLTWKPVTASRIDTRSLQKALPDVAERFTVTNTYRRFQVA